MDGFAENPKDPVDKASESDDTRSEQSTDYRTTSESSESCIMNEENDDCSSTEMNDSIRSLNGDSLKRPLASELTGDASRIKTDDKTTAERGTAGDVHIKSDDDWIEDERQEDGKSNDEEMNEGELQMQVNDGRSKKIEVIRGESGTDQTKRSFKKHKSRHWDQSIESFEELPLSAQLLQNIRSSNIEKPNDLQREALPLLLRNPVQNIYLKTRPNSGKKTAFLINLLQRIDPDLQRTQAIIIAPTAELVYHIVQLARGLAQHMNIRVFQVSGQDPQRPQHRTDDHLVVATIGVAMVMNEDRLLDFSSVRCLVLDELDLLLSTEVNRNSSAILIKMLRATATQLSFFSTSFCNDGRRFVEKFAAEKVVIRNILPESGFVASFLQFHNYSLSDRDRERKLIKIMKNVIKNKILVYALGWARAERVAGLLEEHGFRVILITSRTWLTDRLEAIRRFNSSQKQTILCTNYPIGHGIPLDDVNIVINYDLPKDRNYLSVEYVHRISKCNTVNGKPAFIVNLTNKLSRKYLRRLARYFRTEMIDLRVKHY